MSALTIGFTTARAPECKRGVAVNVAASLARSHPRRHGVCVVDADPLTRDVTTRLPLRGPVLEDFAGRKVPDVDHIAALDAPPVAVVGSGGNSLGRVRLAAETAMPLLREEFDVLIVDLVGGPAGPGRAVGDRLQALDWLLVAVTPEPGAVAAAANFFEHFETARARGVVDPGLRVGVVVTGDEGSTRLSPGAVAGALAAPVVGLVPQLWGRAEPNLGFGPALAIPELDAAVFALFERLTRPLDAVSAGL